MGTSRHSGPHAGLHGDAPVRVGLVGCSGLLGDIIADAVRRDPRIAVVVRLDAGAADPGTGMREVDFVIWNGAEESQVRRWLDRSHPGPRVLVTVEDGRRASLWELAPHRTELGALSPDLLAQTVRTGAPPASPDLTARWEKP